MGASQTLPGSLLQGRVSLWMSLLCACSPGSCAWLFLSPVSSQEPWGVPLPALPCSPGPGFLPLSHPSLGPCQGPWCQGRVPLNGAEKDRGDRSCLTLCLSPCCSPSSADPTVLGSLLGVRCAAGMGLTLLRPHQAHTAQRCEPQHRAPKQTQTPKQTQHPISVPSAVFGSSWHRPTLGWVCSRGGPACSAGAALGWGFGLSCHTLAGVSCWTTKTVPVPHTSRSCALRAVPTVLPADKNTSPAAAHLVLWMSLGNSNKKLKIQG